MSVVIPFDLTDTELEAATKSLAQGERGTTAKLVAHLAAMEERRFHLKAGFSSLYGYCITVLRLSEGGAYNRIEVARMARRFPAILDKLADGSLNLGTARLLAPLLNADNGPELVAAASGKSKREVEELVARYAPRPDVPSTVRKLPTPGAATVAAPTTSERAVGAPFVVASPPPAPARPSVVSPLSPDRYEIRFTARAETCEKLRLAKDLLRHAIPSGDTGEIFDRALTLLLEDLARKKFAATPHPRSSPGAAPGSRHIPARVRRAVWLRDGGRCAFTAKTGRRCNERAFVEVDHAEPFAIGGEATIGNLQLRCRAHNSYQAELFYGREKVAAAMTRGRTPPELRRPP